MYAVWPNHSKDGIGKGRLAKAGQFEFQSMLRKMLVSGILL